MEKACEFFTKYQTEDLESLENNKEFYDDFKTFISELYEELNSSEIEEELRNESEEDKKKFEDEIEDFYKCKENVKCIIDNNYDLKNSKVMDSLKEMVTFFGKVNENMNQLNDSMKNLNKTLDNACETLQIHNTINSIITILKNNTIFNISEGNKLTITKDEKTLKTYLANIPYQDVDYVVKMTLDRSINFKNELIDKIKNSEVNSEEVKKISNQLLIANIIEILIEVKKFHELS